MEKKNSGYKIFNGRNYRILKTQDFGQIVFGCPPDIIKEFKARNERAPSRYVIPDEALLNEIRKTHNSFDFEFIFYNFLFVDKSPEKLSIFCKPLQEKRLRVVLEETLFGPKFVNLIKAQFRRIAYKYKFSEKDKKLYADFLKLVSRDKRLYGVYDKSLKLNVSDKKLEIEIQKQLTKCLKQFPRFIKKQIPKFLKQLTENYLICCQIWKEMEIFSLTSQKDRDKFIDSIIDFYHFDKNASVYIPGIQDRRKKIKVVQVKPSIFEIYLSNKLLNIIDISNVESFPQNTNFKQIQKPWFGVTFLGVGSGFSHKKKNSSLIAWSECKGIMVDVLNDSSNHAMKYGISENDIKYFFLSHVHSDHDGGLIEKILIGQRMKVVSTRIIFESFLRKAEAITCISIEDIEKLIDFIEVEPNKPIKLPGFRNTFFTFDYSLHSIPAGRFKLACKVNGLEKVISHSGDTKHNEEMINTWYEKGYFTRKRKQNILKFIWDADLIIHDIGGGALHTDVRDLMRIDANIQKRTVLVHQHDKPRRLKYLKYAKEGETRVLIDKNEFDKGIGMNLMNYLDSYKTT